MDRFSAAESAPESSTTLSTFVGRFSGLSEEFLFYENTIRVVFDREAHQYFLVEELGNLTPLLNVSTVSHIVDKSFALVPWASKMAIEKLLRTVPVTMGRVIMELDAFTKLALEAKSAHKDILEDAGTVGHMAHDWIESYIKARLASNEGAVRELVTNRCTDERATSATLAMLKWELAHNVRWVETERKVYSRKHRCSGTMDGLAYTDSCSDPTCCSVSFKDHLSLIDWKTSNYLYTEYLYQTAAYQGFFMEEFPDKKVVDRWVIRLGKEDAEFDPWYLPAETFETDFNGFLTCLSLRRTVDIVEERMKACKKAKRVAKKEARDLEKNRIKAEKKEAKLKLKEEKNANK